MKDERVLLMSPSILCSLFVPKQIYLSLRSWSQNQFSAISSFTITYGWAVPEGFDDTKPLPKPPISEIQSKSKAAGVFKAAVNTV